MLADAVLFDLDDTLYLQSEWLAGAWDAVAERATAFGISAPVLRASLEVTASEGSDRGAIIDRALAAINAACDVAPLVEAFRAHAPTRLSLLHPELRGMLDDVRRRIPIGLVTDGEPRVQEAKLDALGLADAFDAVIVSDVWGRNYRKPHRLPFDLALAALGVDAERAVFIGDRPDKDIVGAGRAGIRAIRVRTGEYRACPNIGTPWGEAGDVIDALALLAWEPASRQTPTG